MFLKQVLQARLGKNVFTAYKYKDHFLVRQQSAHTYWQEYKKFEYVLEALEWFQITIDIEKTEDPEIPF